MRVLYLKPAVSGRETMRAKFLLPIVAIVFLVTMLNWARLEQFLTLSAPFTPGRQKNELQQKREDKMFVENIENSRDSDGQGESKTQEQVVIVREEEEKEEEKEEEEKKEKESGGLLDWLHEQQERKASLAAACARDPR